MSAISMISKAVFDSWVADGQALTLAEISKLTGMSVCVVRRATKDYCADLKWTEKQTEVRERSYGMVTHYRSTSALVPSEAKVRREIVNLREMLTSAIGRYESVQE